jgi:3-hydroxybutyryl-CoA dehydrogenase
MSPQLKRIGVCGAAGTMGAGIAIVAARAGFDVLAFDLDDQGLARAAGQQAAFFAKSVERGRMSPEARDAALARLRRTSRLGDLGDCDLVLEAVFEDLGVKKSLMRDLDGVCREDAIFASNTSTLSITEIASGSTRPERVVGLHFCLPAQLMKLVEVSPGLLTSDETFRAAWSWTEACGQAPVLTQDRPGFILNALLVPFNNDAIRAVEAEVAPAEEIDRAIKAALGYKMGPLELLDLIGLDTQLRLCEAFYPITLDRRLAAPPLLRRMVAAGSLGRKAGRGFYVYDGPAMFGA